MDVWMRVDVNIGQHDKVLALLADPSPLKWRAFTSYVAALGWSVMNETDGHIPDVALAAVHGTPRTAALLSKHGLWEKVDAAHDIHNFLMRQQSRAEGRVIAEGKREGGRHGNCLRWHGSGCWDNGRCSREDTS